jgi:hypothetical protein
MNDVDLARTDALYSVATSVEVRRHRVAHAPLSALAQGVGRLGRALGDELNDPYWIDVLRSMRTFVFVVSATPLPLNDPALALGPLIDRLLQRIHSIEETHPSFSAHVRHTMDQMILVAGSSGDPLGDAIRTELAGSRGSEVLVLLRKAARVAVVRERLMHTLGTRLHVATTHLLGREALYERMVAIGPSRWFTEALGAPRAPRFDLFRFDWVRDQPMDAALLAGSRSLGRRLHASSLTNGSDSGADAEAGLPDDFLEPRIAWTQIHESILTTAPEDDQAGEEVQARLFLLPDSYAVYVEAEEGARSYVLDPNAELNDRVDLLPADELSAGMFLILRTEGGDDRTILADRILGGRAAFLRDRQEMWKNRLREKVHKDGPAAVIRQLSALGSMRAGRANLRTWASSRSKRTRDYPDFLAIMRLVELETEAPQLWGDMGIIVSAHRQAGQQVRAVLIRRMEKADLTRLETEGRLDFEAPDLGGGTLTVFRIEEVSPEPRLIPDHRVDRPFRLEAELWHG